MSVDLPPTLCAYCAKGEHHLCRPDVTPCDCDNERCRPAQRTGDDAFLGAAARCQQIAERRFDRAYDEQSAATIYMPDGSKVASFDRPLCGVMAREVLALHDAERSA